MSLETLKKEGKEKLEEMLHAPVVNPFTDQLIERAYVLGVEEDSAKCEEHCKLAYKRGFDREPYYFEEIVRLTEKKEV